MSLRGNTNSKKKINKLDEIPEPQRQHKKHAPAIAKNLHTIKIGMEDKIEPTSMKKKDHGQAQDQKLDSRTGYQDMLLDYQDVPRYAA